jgi:predicted AAA+ superfamily ATPase
VLSDKNFSFQNLKSLPLEGNVQALPKNVNSVQTAKHSPMLSKLDSPWHSIAEVHVEVALQNAVQISKE